MSSRPSLPHPSNRLSFARVSAALAMLGGLSLLWSAPGCGPGDTSYKCDSTGCFECDGYGCKEVPTPTITPCAFAGDSACSSGTVCTELGCLKTCATDDACEKGLVCKKGLCTPPTITGVTPITCGASTDCSKLGAGALCVDGACVAAPKCEGTSCTCKYSSDCGDGRICVDSKCATSCSASDPCPSGFDCSDKGYCVEGKPVCGTAAAGAACPSGKKCVDGHCTAGCATDDQCLGADGKPDPTQRCVGGACIPDTRTDPKCAGDAQCSTGSQKCVDGFCRYTCTTDATCKAIDNRIGTCSPSELICRSAEDLAAKCKSKSDCPTDKSCVDGQCK